MSNEDFVSRQWLIDEYHRRHQGPPGGALKMIEEAPAADVEPRKRWIPVTERLPKRPENWPRCELRRCYFLVALESGCVKSLGFEFATMEWHTVGSPVTHWRPLPEPPKKKTVNEITPEMIEAAERNEKRIKEIVDRVYDELIAEKRAEIERLKAEIAKMPPQDYEKLAANPPVYPANNGGCCGG